MTVQAPDGTRLQVAVPPGTEPGAMRHLSPERVGAGASCSWLAHFMAHAGMIALMPTSFVALLYIS
eukprot:3502584-Amphidinium_carterae.1